MQNQRFARDYIQTAVRILLNQRFARDLVQPIVRVLLDEALARDLIQTVVGAARHANSLFSVPASHSGPPLLRPKPTGCRYSDRRRRACCKTRTSSKAETQCRFG